jgi:hypothetical protein
MTALRLQLSREIEVRVRAGQITGPPGVGARPLLAPSLGEIRHAVSLKPAIKRGIRKAPRRNDPCKTRQSDRDHVKQQNQVEHA